MGIRTLVCFGLVTMLLLVDSRAGLGHRRGVDLEDEIKQAMAARGIPGMGVAVLRAGKPILVRAYGVANVEHQVPAAVTTPFQLFSNSKPFTGVAVMLLVQDGALSLDDTVVSRLPGVLPAGWNDITVRHLITNTSGLHDIANVGSARLGDGDRDETLRGALAKGRTARAGEVWAYHQVNFVLLQMLIERVSGLTFASFMDSRIFKTIGMTATQYGDLTHVIAGRASTYGQLDPAVPPVPPLPGRLTRVHPSFPRFMHAGAGLNASIGDLARFETALTEGRVLRRPFLDALSQPARAADGSAFSVMGTVDNYGAGWVVGRDGSWAGHFGGNATYFKRFFRDGLAVFVLTNASYSDPESLVDLLAAAARR